MSAAYVKVITASQRLHFHTALNAQFERFVFSSLLSMMPLRALNPLPAVAQNLLFMRGSQSKEIWPKQLVSGSG